MISINGLTPNQVKMLDLMWNFETLEDLHEWQSTLNEADHQMSFDLLQMIALAVMDEEMAEQEFPEARRVLLDIMRK